MGSPDKELQIAYERLESMNHFLNINRMSYTNEEYQKMGLNPEHCRDFRDYLAEQMKDPEFREEYEKLQLQRRVAKLIAEKRQERHMTQRDLASRMNTKQAVISRIESGNVSVGLEMLQRIANALGTKIEIVMH